MGMLPRKKITRKTSSFITLSLLYATLLVVVCLGFVLSEVLTHNVPLYYYEAFFTYLYGLSIFFLLYVFCYLLNDSTTEKKPPKNQKVRKPEVLPTDGSPTQEKLTTPAPRPKKQKTSDNDHSHGSFFLRIGAIAFGLGTMIYNGLEFGVFFEIGGSSPCYQILRGVNPILQLVFTFMQMYFIFMNARLNIHKFKFVARFGENEIKDLKENIDKLFAGKRSVSGILITGMSGVGKSLVGKILHSVYGDKCKTVGPADILSRYEGEAEEKLKKIFLNAHVRAPSLIFIDDIHEICLSREGNNVRNAGIVNALLHLMDGVQNTQSKEVLVIATSSQPDTLDQALRRPGRLSHDITFSLPSEQDRLVILDTLLKEIPSSLATSDLLSLIASRTPGFVASDLMTLISEAFSHSDEEFPSREHFLKALASVKPSSLKGVDTVTRKVSLSDIKGFEPHKQELLRVFRMTLVHRDLFASNGITSPSRILLFGPPGCGKSLLVHGLATRFNLAVLPVRRSNVFAKYFGESEKKLGMLFEQAQKSSPCILHFENLDGLAGRKGRETESGSDVEGRVINQLKVLMDGVVGYERIFVLAETNRPDLLDKNVIRHGRFHHYLHVDLPSLEDRRAVIRHAFGKTWTEVGGGGFKSELEADDFVEDLARRTKGYSVSEVLLLCKEIGSSLAERKGSSSDLNDSSDLDLNKLDLNDLTGSIINASLTDAVNEAFENVSASTSSKMVKIYRDFADVYCPKS